MTETTVCLPMIDEVDQISEADRLCLQEVRAVLQKHDATRRFGVCLLHQHFGLSEDEVLVETCDSDTRTLITKPVTKSSIEGKAIETSWRLDIEQPIGRCISYCEIEDGPFGRSHVRKHRGTL